MLKNVMFKESQSLKKLQGVLNKPARAACDSHPFHAKKTSEKTHTNAL